MFFGDGLAECTSAVICFLAELLRACTGFTLAFIDVFIVNVCVC